MLTKKRLLLKVVILGDAKYIKKQFSFQSKSSIGADFLTKEIILDNTVVQIQFWDTAGQERFNSMGKAFYRNAECCVICFDLTDPKTFQTVDTWRTEFLTHFTPKYSQNFPFLIFGNKCDNVSDAEIKQYCSSRENIAYYETSAKDNVNVEKAFGEVEKLAFKREQNIEEMESLTYSCFRNNARLLVIKKPYTQKNEIRC